MWFFSPRPLTFPGLSRGTDGLCVIVALLVLHTHQVRVCLGIETGSNANYVFVRGIEHPHHLSTQSLSLHWQISPRGGFWLLFVWVFIFLITKQNIIIRRSVRGNVWKYMLKDFEETADFSVLNSCPKSQLLIIHLPAYRRRKCVLR